MVRHRQLHLWITDYDYGMLRTLANSKQETISSVIRRLIKTHPASMSIPGRTYRPAMSLGDEEEG
jgi:hypothetical protein